MKIQIDTLYEYPEFIIKGINRLVVGEYDFYCHSCEKLATVIIEIDNKASNFCPECLSLIHNGINLCCEQSLISKKN